MVNVTKSNFIEQCNDLIKHVPTAAFVAIDEEMTGISLPGWSRLPKDDSPEERYERLKAVPQRYSIIQVGIALFHENPEYRRSVQTSASVDTAAKGQNKTESANQSGGTANPENSNGAHPLVEPEFLVRKYNFYLFPNSSNNNNNKHTREVTLNPSAVAFLAEHKMDFNLWMKEGISYVTGEGAKKITENFEERHRKIEEEETKRATWNEVGPPPKDMIQLVNTEDIRFHARAMSSLRDWIDSAVPPRSQSEGDTEETEGVSFLLPPCNAFLRRSFYERIQVEYPSLVLEKAPNNQIRVWRLSVEEKQNRRKRLKREEWERLESNQIGFWKVFRALSEACRGVSLDDDNLPSGEHRGARLRRVPIVVHNGFMDLLFLLTHFHCEDLPPTYGEAKTLIHRYFPVLYDTKILATECSSDDIRNGNTALSELYGSLGLKSSHRFRIVNPTEAAASDSDGNAERQVHEAAYDAYMTGCILVELCRRIVGEAEVGRRWREIGRGVGVGFLYHLVDDGYGVTFESENGVAKSNREDLASNSMIASRKYFGRNKLYLMQTLYTIDLESRGSDPLSRGMSTTTTYRVTGIDKSITTRDIIQALCNLVDTGEENGLIEAGGENHESGLGPTPGRRVAFEIVWVDDVTFMVATRRPSSAGIHSTNQGTVKTLERHGKIILSALKKSFPTQEIITLEEHLKRSLAPDLMASTGNQSNKLLGEIKNFAFKIVGAFQVSKRKRSNGLDEESRKARGNKRARIAVN